MNLPMRLFLSLIIATIISSGFTDNVLSQGVADINAEIVIDRDIIESLDIADKPDSDFVFLPIPISNPTVDTGIALAGAWFYQLDPESPASVTGVGVMQTTNGTRGAGIFQRINAFSDRLRADLAFGQARINYDFFGVGNGAGDRGISVPVRQTGFFLLVQAQWRLLDHFYLGPRFRLLTASTHIDRDEIDVDTPPEFVPFIPERELKITSGALGIAATYDTRDDPWSPSDGTLVTIEANFADPAFGGAFKYRTLTTALNKYFRINDNKVIAARLSFCSVGGHVPFFDLCLFGTESDLRGYVGGQFRDKTMFATQAEYRWRFTDRFGFVAFAGLGSVAESLSDFSGDDFLYSGGVGLRYLASTDFGVNVGVDFAVGQGSNALYFRIGEAF